MSTATKTNPGLWERSKRDAKARMGGKHSARAMQLATQLYKKRGGGYSGSKPTSSTNSLKKWTKQKWEWSGGSKDKGVYLPRKKADRLRSTETGRNKLRAAGRKKSKATREGRQYSSHGLASGTSLKKEASMYEKLGMMGNSPFTQKMMKGSGLPGYADGGPVKSDGYLTDKGGKPYARVHQGEKVVPRDMGEVLKKVVGELHKASKMHKSQAERIEALLGKTKEAWAKIAGTDARLERAGVSGYNKPKRTPGHPTKSHIVVAKDGDQVKTIRFGQQGVRTNQTAGQREAFKSRHAKNIKRGKLSAAYWADRVKWSPSKTKDKSNKKWIKGS